MAERRLSAAVNGRENLLYTKLITYRTADRAVAGQENGHQVTAGSVAIVGLGHVGLPTAVACTARLGGSSARWSEGGRHDR